jgi:hypothetical protein
MADDNSARYRSTEPFGGGASATPASDPLAELARLIGRGDPLAENGREARAPAQPAPDTNARYDEDPAPSFLTNPMPQYPSDPAPQHYSEPAPQHYEPAPSYDPSPQHYQPAPQPYGHEPAPQHYEPAPQHYGADPAPRYSPEYPTHNGWPGLPAAPEYPAGDPFVPTQQQYSPAPPAPQRDDPRYAQPNFMGQPYADPRGRPGMDNHFPDRTAYGAADFPAPLGRPGYAPPLYPQEPEAGGMPPPHDDGFYDDQPRGGRRKGLLTVVAVLGLAVIGTAGAFGYRSMFGGSGSSASPPVIRASSEPSKVAPPAAVPDASASKFSYDRFGDAGKDEQVVRREEKPVDLMKVAPPPATAPRQIFPAAPPAASAANPATTATAATTAANPPSAIGEPRRVRTVPIRPEQGGDAAAPAPAQRPTNTAALAPQPRAARPAAPAPAGNAPLSLAPEANNALALPPQSSPLPPPSRALPAPPPPARIASAPVSGGGSYLVQVSSQKSEADAESAYRGIKSKYSSVLGSHPHQVRRADLGAKGVFYRAMVGPFGSREEAVQVCSSLKQAGGDCVVQH